MPAEVWQKRPDLLAAEAMGAELVVTHHPVIFKPIRSVTTGALVPELIFRMAEAGIAQRP